MNDQEAIIVALKAKLYDMKDLNEQYLRVISQVAEQLDTINEEGNINFEELFNKLDAVIADQVKLECLPENCVDGFCE